MARTNMEDQIYGVHPREEEQNIQSKVITDPLLRPAPSLNDFCYNITFLQDLARQGSWRSVLDQIAQARKLSLLQQPHEHLAYLAYNVLALTKLRRYGEAAEELATIDDFDRSEYKYETHPSYYHGKSGSMVPFSLRWLHAELPYRLGRKQETVDRLYKLLDFIQNKLQGRDSVKQSAGELGTESIEPLETPGSIGSPLPVSNSFTLNPETQQDLPSSPSSVPFPFPSISVTNAEDGVSINASPLEMNGGRLSVGSSASPSEFVNSTTIQLGDGGIRFESLKIDEPVAESGGVETSQQLVMDPRRSADGLSVAGGNELSSNILDEDFGEYVTSKAIEQKMPVVSRNEDTYSALSTSLGRWRRREEIVINSILSHHLSQKEFNASMKWLEKLLKKNPADPFLLSKLGYVQMQLGDLNGAKNTFSRIEAMVNQGQVRYSLSLDDLKNMVNRNKALQHLVVKDYTAAIREYEEAIDRDPADIVATNNKALCLMYSRDLLGSIKVLENALERVPVVALNENIVLNLCSMYELAFVNNVETKRILSSWIVQIAPEDFDSSCTRL
eukprot:Gb_15408 [translate_table: standard]